MVDLGVRFDNNLTFRDHISEKINKAYSVLVIIKRNFIYMDERTFILHSCSSAILITKFVAGILAMHY